MLLAIFIIVVEVILGKFIIFAYNHIDDHKKVTYGYQVYTYDSDAKENIIRKKKLEEKQL
jgi:hypothetical protein